MKQGSLGLFHQQGTGKNGHHDWLGPCVLYLKGEREKTQRGNAMGKDYNQFTILISSSLELKGSCIYTMEYYSVIKKNEILPYATAWMYLKGIILGEISQR